MSPALPTPRPIAPELLEAAPGIAARLRVILLGLVVSVAGAFLREPWRVALIVPLWCRLSRAAARFDRLMAHLGAAPCGGRPARPASPAPGRGVAPVLPRRKAWLVVAAREQAEGYVLQLEHLLSHPDTEAVIAASPRAAALLRPICCMLCISHPAIRRRRPWDEESPRMAGGRPNVFVTASTLALAGSGPWGWMTDTRPMAERAPCPHVFWPWFPRGTLRPG